MNGCRQAINRPLPYDVEPAPTMHAPSFARPLPVLCAHCVAEGVVPNRDGVSHGICVAHLKALRLTIPLHALIAALEGPEYLSTERRAQLARNVREVIGKVERD